jgi:glucokinase
MSFADFMASLCREVRMLEAEAALGSRRLGGVAVGIPGLVSPSGVPQSVVNLPALSGHDLPALLGRELRMPVQVLNDATAAAYGEFVLGAGASFSSLLLMTLGTGIGGGLVLNGDLWTGADGVAGEVGHLTVEPDGRSCSCGSHGCLEQYASASAIGEAWLRATGVPVPEGAGTADAVRSAADAARDGHPLARDIFASAGRYLGIAVAGIANLLNLEAVILGGGLAGSLDLFMEPLKREVAQRAFPVTAHRLAILPGLLGDDAGVLGAVAHMRNNAIHGEGEESI